MLIYTIFAKEITKKTSRHVLFKRFYTKPEDYEEALKHHPIDMTPEQWRQQCEFFTSPAFLARSEQNRINRGNMKYVTTQGTKSLAQRRHELAFGQRRGQVRGIGRRVKGKSSSSRAQSTQSQPPSQDWVNDMSVMFNLFSSQMDPSNMDPAKLAMFNMLKSKYSTPAPQPSQTHMDQGSPAHSQHSAASSDMHTSSTSQPQHLVLPLSQPLPQPSHPPPPYPYMYGPPYPFMYGGISQQHPSAFFPVI
ncbi:hypothetical protein F8388_026946 [Cannabis sativa]|uniref:Uncharacterized protein n=1 Tax=Cannabis sativa TaxID=3483 RepID=A0A7J6DYL7_CANSA|nr:hypothetical protein G4B88_019347 [Cannabis sativa]KAF4389217.1 hypothetical protein F8388_026946 [Cannabis sativa]